MMHRRLTTAGIEVAPHYHQLLVLYTHSGPKYRWRWDIHMNILAFQGNKFWICFFHNVCDDLGHSKTTNETTKTDNAMTLLSSSPEARANGARFVTVYTMLVVLRVVCFENWILRWFAFSYPNQKAQKKKLTSIFEIMSVSACPKVDYFSPRESEPRETTRATSVHHELCRLLLGMVLVLVSVRCLKGRKWRQITYYFCSF